MGATAHLGRPDKRMTSVWGEARVVVEVTFILV